MAHGGVDAVAPERSTAASSMHYAPVTMACTSVATRRPGNGFTSTNSWVSLFETEFFTEYTDEGEPRVRHGVLIIEHH